MATGDRQYIVPEGVHPLLAGILTTTHERHEDMVNLVKDLPPDALVWRPGPEMSSLAGLVHHMMDDELGFARSITGEYRGWPGKNGADMDAVDDAAGLVARIAAGDATIKRIYVALTDAQLGRKHPHSAHSESLGRELVEVAHHASMHYGHMQLTRHLWEAMHPDFQGDYEHWR